MFDHFIEQLRGAVKITDPVEKKLFLYDVYDISYAIFNHAIEHTHPFASVLMYPAEEMLYVGLDNHLDEYFLKEISKYTTYSPMEFLNLDPHFKKRLLLRLSVYRKGKGQAITDGMDDALATVDK